MSSLIVEAVWQGCLLQLLLASPAADFWHVTAVFLKSLMQQHVQSLALSVSCAELRQLMLEMVFNQCCVLGHHCQFAATTNWQRNPKAAQATWVQMQPILDKQ